MTEMLETMDMNAYQVKNMIRESQRFISPFSEPYGYYICAGDNERISMISIQKYWEKLAYMCENADMLIQQAFKPEFYDFYGVDQNMMKSSKEMCQQLIVESFVLFTKDHATGCYLSNPQFMYGHYIDCLWSDSWDLIYSYIC